MNRRVVPILAASLLLTGIVTALFVVPSLNGGFPWSPGSGGAPEVVRTFDGGDDAPLARPVAVLAFEGRVFVVDSRRGVIDVFTSGGSYLTRWGEGTLRTPVAVARNPLSGEFFVVDRELGSIVILGDDGTPKGVFAPQVPDAASWSDTPTALWSPLGLDFSPDGYLYVTDVRSRHRLLVFDPSGRFDAEGGRPDGAADALSFPTAVRVRGNEVWVSDSNNMRLQVYDLSGRLVRSVSAPRLPRGLAFAPGEEGPGTVLVADIMSHRIATFDARTGESGPGFGALGSGRDQFSYPNAVAAGDDGLVFVADTGNSRVAVWSWTGKEGWLSTSPWRWSLLLIPLLPLFGLPFALKRPRYFVTADFIRTLGEIGEIELFTGARVSWECLPEDWGALQQYQREGGPIMVMLNPVEGSEPDANALRERYELDEREAAVISAARGSTMLLTQDVGIIRVARAVGMVAEDVEAYVARVAGERLQALGRGANGGNRDADDAAWSEDGSDGN